MLQRITTLLLAAAAAVPSIDCGITGYCAESRNVPNIVFILADDLGYTDVACFGSKYYETPNIDRLATQGMKLLSHHHCQNCTPTRAALMSGQYGARTGVYTVGGTDRFDWSKRPLRPVENVTNLPLDRDIIAKQLKAAGYATGMFGKWHIGLTFRDAEGKPIHDGRLDAVRQIDFSKRVEGGPIDHGFDRFFGTACCPTTSSNRCGRHLRAST